MGKQALIRLLLATSTFVNSTISSQNIVNNPYFDYLNASSCWAGVGGFGRCVGWGGELWGFAYGFHPCLCQPIAGCIGQYQVPSPLHGEGFMGLQVMVNPGGFPYRSFGTNVLLQPLQANETYVIEFWYRPWHRNNYNVDKLGALVTQDTITNANFSNYSPQLEINQPIEDSLNWTHAIGSFVATGGEHLLVIGNFRPTNQTTMIPNPPWINAGNAQNNWVWPMIYIDAVFLYRSTDTLYTATLPADTMLCAGEVLHLQPVLEGFKLEDTTTTYLWSTGSTDSSIVVTQPGTYWVQTTINQRFVASDTIVVTYFPENYLLNLPDTVVFCEGEMATILAESIPLTIYDWSTGAATAYITTSVQGLYWLNAQTPCYPLSDSTWVVQDFCETHIWIPNAFTPDGDGTNDFFQFFGVPEPISLSIYNRWGERVFYSNNYNPEVSGWDGTYKGEPLPGGVYTYLIEYKYINLNANQENPKGSDRQIRGTVQIVR